jgi:PAS domain S-box-containing protein
MKLRVLIVEDSEDDMLLMLRELNRSGYTLDYVRVDTPVAMEAALDRQSWDIAIADYTLPAFSAPEALKLLQNRGLDIPFIIVSGTIGEEIAVAAMKAGAHDYIIKGSLTRLLPAVERELRESEQRLLRRSAEQALRESEARIGIQAKELSNANNALRSYADELAELYNQAPCGYHSLDKNGVFVRINDTELKMLGYSRDQMVGKKRFTDLLTAASLKTFVENFPQLQQRGWVRDLELQMLRSDGTILPVSLSATAIADEEGNYQRSRYVVIDISDRALAENNLKQSEHKFRAIFDSTFQLMGLLTTEGIVVEANRTALDAVGIELKDVVGKPFWDTPWWSNSPPQQQQVRNAVSQAASGQLVRFESQHLLADGTLGYVDFSLKPVFDSERKVVMLIPEGRDISFRLQAEAKIREQAALLDITTDAIFVRDLEHRLLFWNKGAERLYEWQSEAVLGKNTLELLYRAGETLPQFAAIETILLQQGQWQGELQHVTANGKTIIVESRWTLVRDSVGNPTSILTVSTDITEKKQLESQLMRVQRLESLGTLASGIAHDFNNILTPILAAVQLLPMKITKLDEQTRGLLQLIEDSTKRGAGLVKQILSFARGAEGKRVPLQVEHIVAEVTQVALQTFPKNISLNCDKSSVNLWTVAADANQLHQVLLNLCVNARDAMPNGGTLSLCLENQVIDSTYARMNLAGSGIGSYVMITVADTGTGIKPELIERIFDPFFTTKEPGKGTGLGLSTVLGIVKNHNGFIKVYSEVGKGTQFRVYLPATFEPVKPQVTELELLSGQQELILIVDDEPLIQQVIQTTLEAYNYRTLLASDGFEAVSVYVEYSDRIGAVLMDIMMPSMDGLTAIRTLQELNPQVRIIATSGLATNSHQAEEVGASVKAFLPKPYTAKELLDSLQKVLSNTVF